MPLAPLKATIEATLTMRPAPHHRAHHVLREYDGRQSVQPHHLFDFGIVHHRQRAGEPQRGVIDEAIQGTKFLTQTAHQRRNIVDLAEIERHKVQRTPSSALGLCDCRDDLAILRPRYGDCLIVGGGELLRDGKAETSAAAGHKHAPHHLRVALALVARIRLLLAAIYLGRSIKINSYASNRRSVCITIIGLSAFEMGPDHERDNRLRP
jgi:hypothetical protein